MTSQLKNTCCNPECGTSNSTIMSKHNVLGKKIMWSYIRCDLPLQNRWCDIGKAKDKCQEDINMNVAWKKSNKFTCHAKTKTLSSFDEKNWDVIRKCSRSI